MDRAQSNEPQRHQIQATSVYAMQRTEEMRRRREELRARREALEREHEALAREEAALAARIEEEIRYVAAQQPQGTGRAEIENLIEAYHHHNSDAHVHRQELDKIHQLAVEHWYALAALWPWFSELRQAAEEGNRHREWLKEEIQRLGLNLPEPESYALPNAMEHLAPVPNIPRNASWLHVLTELGLKYSGE